MGKEKVRIEETEEKYFYEIVGILIIVFGLIILGGLGKFGTLAKLLSRFLLGDFYFLFIIGFIGIGIKTLLKKKMLDTHSVIFQGFIIVSLGLLCLSHISIYDELNLKSTSVITSTIKLYKNYYKYYNDSYICGGGIIGALVFQILILFFGKIGTIVLSIIFIIVGISFISNASVFSFVGTIKKIKNIFKKCFNGIFTYFRHVDYTRKKEVKTPLLNVNLNILSDIKQSSNVNIQLQLSKETEENIKVFLKQFSLPVIYENFYVGLNSTTFKFTIIGENNIKLIQTKLFDFFNKQCFFIGNKNVLLVESYNKFKELLTLKRSLINIFDEQYLLPIGVNNALDDICLDLSSPNYYIISGDLGSGVKTYVRSLIVSIILKLNNSFKIFMLDTKSEFRELDLLNEYIEYTIGNQRSLEVLDELCLEIERRRELFNFLSADCFEQANEEIKKSHHKLETLNPYFVFLNTSINKHSSDFENKINFLNKFSSKMGIYIFVIARKRTDLGNITLNNANKICFYSNNLDLSLKLINSEICSALQKKGDVLYQVDNQIYHGQSPYLSISDYEKVLRKLI